MDTTIFLPAPLAACFIAEHFSMAYKFSMGFNTASKSSRRFSTSANSSSDSKEICPVVSKRLRLPNETPERLASNFLFPKLMNGALYRAFQRLALGVFDVVINGDYVHFSQIFNA